MNEWMEKFTILKHYFEINRGFVKLKKIQKSEKNSEVAGWVKPQLKFTFFLEILRFFVFFVLLFVIVHVSKKNEKMDKGVGGWGLDNPSFSRIFRFFLTWQGPLVILKFTAT